MLTIGNLHRSLCRRCSVPTSPTLPHASLRRQPHARIEGIPLVTCRTSFTTSSSSTLVVSGELERFPLSISDFREIRGPGLAYSTRRDISPSLTRHQRFSSFAVPGDLESHSLLLCCDTSMDSSPASNTTSFSRCVALKCKICVLTSPMLKL
jgi:hypothetical protein